MARSKKHRKLKTETATSGLAVEPWVDPVEDHEARRKRSKREALDLMNLEQETQEMRLRNFQNWLGLLTQLCPNWRQTDACFRLKVEDMAKNIIRTGVGLDSFVAYRAL